MQSYCSTRLSNSLTPEEKKVFELQFKKPVFERYGDLELQTEVQLLLFKLSVITGWKLPEDESYLTVLVDQFVKKIREDYQHLNAEEVEHAFRKNTQIKDWGKAFNLSLIDQVFIPYTHERREIKEFVERLPENYTLLTMPADWKELCELNYQQFLTGDYKLDLWPWEMYDEFVRCEMMATDAYEDYLTAAYKSIISKECATNDEREKMLEIKTQFLNHPQVIEGAKRLAVVKLYIHAKKQGFKNLFVKA